MKIFLFLLLFVLGNTFSKAPKTLNYNDEKSSSKATLEDVK